MGTVVVRARDEPIAWWQGFRKRMTNVGGHVSFFPLIVSIEIPEDIRTRLFIVLATCLTIKVKLRLYGCSLLPFGETRRRKLGHASYSNSVAGATQRILQYYTFTSFR